ncbi:MAG: hypothetical protein Q4E22_05045 [Coriobacteriia bacterium]|nr:hypothetical protein [Coriobacteriia bacterium]
MKTYKAKIYGLVFLILLLTSPRIFAYWEGSIFPQLPNEQNLEITIGRWLRFDSSDPNSPPVVHFDANNPPATKIEEGSIIIYKDSNGEVTIYKALVDIDPNHEDFDPGTPNLQWTQPMTYSENTAGYRNFHHYRRGDYVIYNGELYQYINFVNHNPNTVSEKSPDYPDWWSKVQPPEGISTDDLWYRHIVYGKGDIVYFKGKWFEALLPGRSGIEPNPQVNTRIWKRVS